MNGTGNRTNRQSNFRRRSWKLAAALLVAVTTAVPLGLGAAPASAAATASVYDNAFIEHPNTAPCRQEDWGSLGSMDYCQFNSVDVLRVTAPQYVQRQDSASAYYPGRGWVTQPVSNPIHIADCNQRQCSINVAPVVGVPPWVNPVTSTWWISSSGGLDQVGQASITPGFTWIHMHSDLCVWDGKKWSYHKSIDHYIRADLSFWG